MASSPLLVILAALPLAQLVLGWAVLRVRPAASLLSITVGAEVVRAVQARDVIRIEHERLKRLGPVIGEPRTHGRRAVPLEHGGAGGGAA